MQKYTSKFLILLFLIFTNFSFGTILYPYLQSTTSNSVYITWKTSSNTQSLLKFGNSSSTLKKIVNGTTVVMSDNGYVNNYYYHTVKLTGLNPNTKYFYLIKTGSDSSEVCNFKTFPVEGNAVTKDGHIRLIIMGDNQIKAKPRFDSLVTAAKRKSKQLYGGDISEQISAIQMVGDQVDVGTLDHYEYVHFGKNKSLSPYIPIFTTVGNHETYGTLKLNAYYNHFYYDSIAYKGVFSKTENFYSYQIGRILMVSLSSEHTGSVQMDWFKKVIKTAEKDTGIDFILSFAHRPYQAEQYVGDISTWIRGTVIPWVADSSSKFIMHVGAHHHLYARGQLKDYPIYNVISGGTAWDQYWGMSTETDFDDVQKTISNWAYQIIDFDCVKKRMDVASYSIGSIYKTIDNELIDSFHFQKKLAKPNTPSIIHSKKDTLTLPDSISSTKFSTSITERLNSTQFQVSQNKTFTSNDIDILKDYEDLFGKSGSNPDSSIDQNKNVDILKLKLGTGSLNNGKFYIRVRHRDRNLSWSNWSLPDSFVIKGSIVGKPTIISDKFEYTINENIVVTFSNGPNNPKDWIGIYKMGDVPGSINSTTWKYTSGVSGQITFTLKNPGLYYITYFEKDGYTEIAKRIQIYVGKIPVLSTDKSNYKLGTPTKVFYKSAANLSNDWIGIYHIGDVPKLVKSSKFGYVNSDSGTLTFTGLSKGYYFTSYFLMDSFTSIGQKAYFSVGDTITKLNINKTQYDLGEYISAVWQDGPGNPKDWLGVYDSASNPNIQPLLSYTYIDGKPSGKKDIKDTLLPKKPGKYYLVLFTNDSYSEVSNRNYFTVVDTMVTSIPNSPEIIENKPKIYPNPSSTYTIIESQYPIARIEVLNSAGEVVYKTENVDSMNFTLLNHELPKGMYFLRVDSRKQFTYKLIVK